MTMRFLGVLLLFATSLTMAKEVQAPTAPYQVELWARASYDTSGTLTSLNFVDANDYPAPFLARVETQLRQEAMEPKVVDGMPATFDTGIVVRITITPKPGGADAHIDSISDTPLALRRTLARYPQDLSSVEGWSGEVVASCLVGVEGRCGPIEIVDAGPILPESAKRFARDSLARWTFEPQRVGGKPVTAEVRVPFHLKTNNSSLPPKHFGK